VLLHFLWQGAAAGILGALALEGIRPEAARLRHRLACLMLVVLAALPAASFLRATLLPPALPPRRRNRGRPGSGVVRVPAPGYSLGGELP
jgi:hypothetical protein